MTNLFLIAHKVRGEPAFDIAHQMPCPHCAMDEQGVDCHECDSLGYWWIIPTSGHRAYPWWHTPLDCQLQDDETVTLVRTLDLVPPMPDGLPDHYTTRAAPTLSLADALGLSTKPKAPSTPIKRRF